MAALVGVGLAAAVTLSACTSGGGSGGTSPAAHGSSTAPSPAQSSSTTPASTGPAPAAVITTTPASRSRINPATPITVAVDNGKLTTVRLVNAAGKVVSGALSADNSSWHATEVLGYGKQYTLSAAAVNADGKAVNKTEHLTTLTPDNMTMPTLERMGGYTLTNHATYGVGIIPVVHFDEAITDKAAAQKALKVTTTPQVQGVWSWTDDQDVAFRPRYFWPAGTKVTVEANVYGTRVGSGLYGESDVKAAFTVGRKQVTIADDNSPKIDKVRVYNAAGKVLRTMNTSMGKHATETLPNGVVIDFHTMEGTYTVLEHDNPAIMSSASYGLPANAPGGYAPEKIYYSSKISTDGVYLHELNTTVWAQNSGVDTSHGCLNLDTANAVWFYNHSLIGDPVEIRHTDGPTITVAQGGDWSVSWAKWNAGSALH
jgi:lipoprotein-anchoring transpeptidase ErfK/SrfK